MAYRELPEVYKIVAFTEAKRIGDQAIIAQETGFSVSHVNNVLRGRRNNLSIVNKAYRMVKDRTTNLQKLASATA
jgi:predicted transcriptional regulator